jgi:hypothetical protein
MDKTTERVEGQSGQEIGSKYVERVRAYLTSGEALPLLPSGDVNVSAIADKAKVPRQSMYKNGTIRNLIEKARTDIAELANQGVEAPAVAATSTPQEVPELSGKSKQQQMLERRVQALEKTNISIVAENAELRRQLRDMRLQLGREDMIIESGRRIPPLP